MAMSCVALFPDIGPPGFRRLAIPIVAGDFD
jgi:hypothetical protein